jgi:hypothetical protein
MRGHISHGIKRAWLITLIFDRSRPQDFDQTLSLVLRSIQPLPRWQWGKRSWDSLARHGVKGSALPENQSDNVIQSAFK